MLVELTGDVHGIGIGGITNFQHVTNRVKFRQQRFIIMQIVHTSGFDKCMDQSLHFAYTVTEEIVIDLGHIGSPSLDVG